MIDPRFHELEIRATSVLREPHRSESSPSIGHRGLLLQAWQHPTWGPWKSWSVYSPWDGNDSACLVRRVTWEQLADRAGMNDPQEVARRLAEPTLDVRDAALEEREFAALRNELSQIQIPLMRVDFVSIDGSSSGIRNGGTFEMEWANDGPVEWVDLVRFHESLIERCERLFADPS